MSGNGVLRNCALEQLAGFAVDEREAELRIDRVLRAMPQTRWSAYAWSVVRVEFKRALALRSEIRRAGWFN
jgi:hypothetical protein